MYILPSGRKICEAQAEFISYAMWSRDESVFFTFGKRAGRVIPIASVREEARKNVKESDRQFIIPRVGDNTRRRWIVGFAELCVSMWNPELVDELLEMAKNQVEPEQMIAAIAECPENSIYGWDQHRADRLAEYREAWFETLPFRIRSDQQFWFPGDSPADQKIREHMRQQQDNEHFVSRLEVDDPKKMEAINQKTAVDI